MEAQYTSIIINEARKEKIAALYRREELEYEEELRAMGLSFRKERL